MNHHSCLRCGHHWKSKSECPEQCPGCDSFSYDLPWGMTNGLVRGCCALCGSEYHNVRARKEVADYHPTLCRPCRDNKRSAAWHKDRRDKVKADADRG